MSKFDDKYGPLTEEQIVDLNRVVNLYNNPMDIVALLIQKVADMNPTYGNVQYVLDSLAGEVEED